MALFARAGLPWLSVPVLGAAVSAALYFVIGGIFWLPALALFCALAAFFGWFFRDPDRVPEGADGILCPADGKVSRIWEEDGDVVVAVFMNVHNVHVNRMPLDGKVVSVSHRPGGFLPAYEKDSIRNERVETILDTAIGRVKVVQIAGFLVRRIVPYVKPGDKVARNQRLGIICFGSRVDTYLPKDKITVNVKVGDTVLATKTVLARAK